MILTPIEIIALILSVIGTIFVIKHNWIGYFIWFQANLFWLTASYIVSLNGGVILFSIYQVLNIYGMYDWKFRILREKDFYGWDDIFPYYKLKKR